MSVTPAILRLLKTPGSIPLPGASPSSRPPKTIDFGTLFRKRVRAASRPCPPLRFVETVQQPGRVVRPATGPAPALGIRTSRFDSLSCPREGSSYEFLSRKPTSQHVRRRASCHSPPTSASAGEVRSKRRIHTLRQGSPAPQPGHSRRSRRCSSLSEAYPSYRCKLAPVRD